MSAAAATADIKSTQQQQQQKQPITEKSAAAAAADAAIQKLIPDIPTVNKAMPTLIQYMADHKLIDPEAIHDAWKVLTSYKEIHEHIFKTVFTKEKKLQQISDTSKRSRLPMPAIESIRRYYLRYPSIDAKIALYVVEKSLAEHEGTKNLKLVDRTKEENKASSSSSRENGKVYSDDVMNLVLLIEKHLDEKDATTNQFAHQYFTVIGSARVTPDGTNVGDAIFFDLSVMARRRRFLNTCHACQKPGGSSPLLLLCSRCHCVRYCNPQCSAADQTQHIPYCKANVTPAANNLLWRMLFVECSPIHAYMQVRIIKEKKNKNGFRAETDVDTRQRDKPEEFIMNMLWRSFERDLKQLCV